MKIEKETQRNDDDDDDDDGQKDWMKQPPELIKTSPMKDSNDDSDERSSTAADDSTSAVASTEAAAAVGMPISTNSNMMMTITASPQRLHKSTGSILTKPNITQERSRLWQQATISLVIMATSTVLFLTTFLPMASFVSLLIWLGSLGMAFQVAYRALLVEYQNMLQHDGLRPYLPDSIYQQLTQTTVHEYMTDPSFGLEHRHMLLYFLPLSADQLEYYIRQLAPRHQYALQRPGLGHLFGENFMRHIVGEPAWRQMQPQSQQQQLPTSTARTIPQEQQQQQPPLLQEASTSSNHPLVIHRVMNVDDDDEGSDFGLEVTESDLPGGLMSEQQASDMARFLGIAAAREQQQQQRAIPRSLSSTCPESSNGSSALQLSSSSQVNQQDSSQQLQQQQNSNALATKDDDDDDDEQAALNQEGQAIYDAFYSLAVSYSTSAYQSAGQVLYDLVDSTAPTMIRTSLGLSVLSLGVGLVGWWQGVYFQQYRSTRHRHWVTTTAAPAFRDASTTTTTSLTRTTMNPTAVTSWLPSPWVVGSTGVLGGVLAGTVALVRYGVRVAFLLPSPSASSRKSKEEKEEEEKKKTTNPTDKPATT